MVKDAETFAEEDKKLKEKVEARNELESYVYSLKNQVLLRVMSLRGRRLGIGPGSYPFLFTGNITSLPPFFCHLPVERQREVGSEDQRRGQEDDRGGDQRQDRLARSQPGRRGGRVQGQEERGRF